MKRSAQLKRTGPPRRKARVSTAKRLDVISDATRAEVARRSNGRCEICRRRADHMHHRKLRRHGDHSAANLLHLCFRCHAWIHANVAESYERGWLVRSWDTV